MELIPSAENKTGISREIRDTTLFDLLASFIPGILFNFIYLFLFNCILVLIPWSCLCCCVLVPGTLTLLLLDP